jgi:hypothetical protein
MDFIFIVVLLVIGAATYFFSKSVVATVIVMVLTWLAMMFLGYTKNVFASILPGSGSAPDQTSTTTGSAPCVTSDGKPGYLVNLMGKRTCISSSLLPPASSNTM